MGDRCGEAGVGPGHRFGSCCRGFDTDEPGRRDRFRLTRDEVVPEAEQRAVRSLGDDLDSGRWAERDSDLAGLDAAGLGLRLLLS